MRIISKKYLTEPELQTWLDITPDQLNKLRLEHQFPFVRVTRTTRLYHLTDVEMWLSAKRENIPG